MRAASMDLLIFDLYRVYVGREEWSLSDYKTPIEKTRLVTLEITQSPYYISNTKH